MLCRIILFLIVQIFTSQSVCNASGAITVQQRLWFADISASGRYISPAGLNLQDIVFNHSGKTLENGSVNLDLQKDLGVNKGNISQTRIIWDINPSHSIRMDYFAGKFTGAADISARVQLNNIFSAEAKSHIDENIGIKFWKVGWINYGNSQPTDKIRVGFLLDIKSVILSGDVNSSTVVGPSAPIVLKENYSWRMTAPNIGFVIAGKPNHRLNYFIECAGLTNGKNGFLFADYEASLQWFVEPKKNTSIVVGYHTINYENYRQTENSKLNGVRIGGFFYGLEKKF